ncbi:unnamed protein product [Vicia faba]|uniref:Uncharacterized protein n=1 Tax=Vicia faba TaxID=3906 RepID=A0AAV1AMK3_VICFA|nr:unnamed protein product [Vicia faba]
MLNHIHHSSYFSTLSHHFPQPSSSESSSSATSSSHTLPPSLYAHLQPATSLHLINFIHLLQPLQHQLWATKPPSSLSLLHPLRTDSSLHLQLSSSTCEFQIFIT